MLTNIIHNVSSLVVVGKWNIHIFNPDWVKENVFNGQNIQMGVSLPLGPLQFKSSSFEMTVSESRISFGLLSNDESSCVEIVLALRSVLRLLSQTPVTAFGINFVFDTDSDLSHFFYNPNKETDDNLVSNANIYKEVKWSIIYPNNNTVNIRLFKNEDNGYRFDVNYNYIVKDCLAIMALINEDSIISTQKNNCMQTLCELFKIKKDE